MNPNDTGYESAGVWARVRAQAAERRARRISPRSTWEPDFGLEQVEVPAIFAERMTGQERKRYVRKQAKRKPRIEGPVITEDMIPPGSLLSDETLARIRAGEMHLTRMPVGPAAPTSFTRRAVKRRRLRAKASRKKNRGR